MTEYPRLFKEWHPTGEIRFWRDATLDRRWELQAKWLRTDYNTAQTDFEEEIEWRKVPCVEHETGYPEYPTRGV